MDEDLILSRLVNIKRYIDTLENDKFIREKELGNESIIQVKDRYKEIIELYQLIYENVDEISIRIQNDIANFYTDFIKYLRATLKLKPDEFIVNKESILSEFERFYDYFKDLKFQIYPLIIGSDKIKKMMIYLIN